MSEENPTFWYDNWQPTFVSMRSTDLAGVKLVFLADYPPRDTNISDNLKEVYLRIKDDKSPRILRVIMSEDDIAQAIKIFKRKGCFTFDDSPKWAKPAEPK